MKDTPEKADIIVGQNIRRLRTSKGISQSDLGTAIGITFQQVQKYEKGTNRVSASKLVKVAAALGVRVEVLFAGIDDTGTSDAAPDTAFTNDELALARDYRAITDPDLRTLVRGMTKKLASKFIAHAA